MSTKTYLPLGHYDETSTGDILRETQISQFYRYHQVATKKMPQPIWRPGLLDITTVGQD
jgi:hypothetical protein